MKNEFKVLSIKEEEKLSLEEKKEYYKKLREYILQRKLTNTTPGATTIAPKLKKITNKICEITTKALTNKNIEIICEGRENIPDGPVIFAQSHQGLLDNFIWIPQIDKHCIVLHHKDVNPLLILCQLNTGLILITKDDEKNSANAKLDTIGLLLRGHSVHWSPEGTYCLSPNRLHLPLRYGVVDAAKKARVPIVPVVHEYYYDTFDNKTIITKIRSKYGKPIYVKENDNLLEKLMEYEESISTLKYELMEKEGIFERKKITNFSYINYVKEIYKNIKTAKVDVDRERENIFTSNNEFYKFHYINDVPFNEFGEFLEPNEVRKLKVISQEQEIKRVNKLLNDLRAKEQIKRTKLLMKTLTKN